jgi:hypothetical protein
MKYDLYYSLVCSLNILYNLINKDIISECRWQMKGKDEKKEILLRTI